MGIRIRQRPLRRYWAALAVLDITVGIGVKLTLLSTEVDGFRGSIIAGVVALVVVLLATPARTGATPASSSSPPTLPRSPAGPGH